MKFKSSKHINSQHKTIQKSEFNLKKFQHY